MLSRLSILLGTLALAVEVLAAIDCKGSVNITSNDVAREVRENCREIGGVLRFPANHTGDINLDGVEVIKGGMYHYGCTEIESDSTCCAGISLDPKPWVLSSSTLKQLGNDTWFWSPNGLSRIILPKLQIVNGSISLQRAESLVELDLKGLEYIGKLDVESLALKRFHLDELKAFNLGHITWANPSFNFHTGDDLEDSLDGIYKNPLNPSIRKPEDYWFPQSSVRIRATTKNKKATLGWTKFPKLELFGEKELNVTLGGPSTESMYIHSLEPHGNTMLRRASTLKKLEVHRYEVRLDANSTEVNLPFDKVSEIDISGLPEFHHISLPPQAADWDNLSLSVYGDRLDFSSIYDSEGKQTWYWPKTLLSLRMDGNFTNDFFASFMEQNTTVKEGFRVNDFSGRLDCDALEEYGKSVEGMTSDFQCSVYNSGASSSLAKPALLASMLLLVSWCVL